MRSPASRAQKGLTDETLPRRLGAVSSAKPAFCLERVDGDAEVT